MYKRQGYCLEVQAGQGFPLDSSRYNRPGNVAKLLKNFPLFIAALRDKKPDGRATIKIEALKQIEIVNEYDLQHLMFALLKAVYPSIRQEIYEDTGYASVRSDMYIRCV